MWAASRRHRVAASIAALTGIINGATMILGAAAIGWTTDNLIVPALSGGRVAAAVWWSVAALILGVSTVRWVTIIVRGIATGLVQHRAQAATRREVLQRYLHLDLSWHRRHAPGSLLSTAVSDVDALWFPVVWFYFTVGMAVMLVAAMVQLFVLTVALGMVGVALVVAVLALNAWYQRRLAAPAREMQSQRSDFSAIALESVEAGQVVRTLGIADAESIRVGAAAQRLRAATVRMSRVSAAFDPALELLPTVAILGVLAVGAPAVEAGQLRVGVLVEVVYLLLTVSIPLNVITRFLGLLPLSAAGLARVGEVVQSTESMGHGALRLPARGPIGVRADAVRVTYRSDVLAGVDLDVRPGEVLAVVGSTGSGKSTLVDVLSRQLDPSSGTVEIAGADAKLLAVGEIPSAVAVAPQSAWLFHGSVRENLALAGPASEAELWAALAATQAADMVRALPEGLDTIVGERGARLSGGQRQRICLARALLQKPRLLLLDDAASAVDPEVEGALLTTLSALRGHTTVILAGGRPGSVHIADRVAYLERGRLVAVGTHDELMAAQPGYRTILAAYSTAAGHG